MLAWRTHIDGAVNIVHTRGRDEMCQTQIGRVLFNAVRHNLVCSSSGPEICLSLNANLVRKISRTLSSGAPLPFGSEWWMSGGDTNTLFAQCQRFALAYGELRTEVDRFLFTVSSRSDETLAQKSLLSQRVHDLGQKISHWLASIQEPFRFRTIAHVTEDDLKRRKGSIHYDKADIFPGRIDVYPDFVTAMAWNMARVLRVLLVSLDVRLGAWACAPAHYHTSTEYQQALRTSQEEAIPDIIASVPYHLGGRLNGKPIMTAAGRESERLSGFVCGEEGGYKALPAMFLIWSLTCVKNCDFTTEEQRAWCKGRLRVIADGVGLKYAHITNEVCFPLLATMRKPLGD
jgi:hypothetical protein